MAWFTTVSASTERSSFTGNKKGPAVTHLASITISPPDPVNPERRGEILRGLNIETPHALYECFTDAVYDIRASDRLIVATREYIIRGVANWPKVGSLPAYMRLIIEDPSTSP